MIFKPGSGDEAEIRREAEPDQPTNGGAATPQQDAAERKAVENAARGFANFLLVREYPDKYILYHKNTRSIWPVQKADILAMQMGPRQDLLALKLEGY